MRTSYDQAALCPKNSAPQGRLSTKLVGLLLLHYAGNVLDFLLFPYCADPSLGDYGYGLFPEQ